MRVLLWPLSLDVFLKSDDALARGIPASELSRPNALLELVFGPAAPAVEAPLQTPPQAHELEPPPTRRARPHPIAQQLMVQRHLRRGPKRKQTKTATTAKRRSSKAPARRHLALMNRPARRKTTTSVSKKRRPPRRHVWLSPRR